MPAPATNRYHPARPEPLVLEDEKILNCPKEDPKSFVCMTPNGARAVVRNKAKVIRWMKDANTVIDYYETDPGTVQRKVTK